MTKHIKKSYKRGAKLSGVTFDAKTAAPVEKCTICGGEVESQPMMRGVCYKDYRSIVSGELELKVPQIKDGVSSPEWFDAQKEREF